MSQIVLGQLSREDLERYRIAAIHHDLCHSGAGAIFGSVEAATEAVLNLYRLKDEFRTTYELGDEELEISLETGSIIEPSETW